MTTDELIARLMELDPEGNKEIYIDAGYGGYLFAGNISVDSDDEIVIKH